MKLVFTEEYFEQYRDWLLLDMESISWQGKNKRLFEEFWSIFFLDGINLKDVIERFNYSDVKIKIGPINSWLMWLCQKFIVFVFLRENLSVKEIAEMSQIDSNTISSILRDFLANKFPEHENYFNETFQMGNILSPNLHLNFQKIQDETGVVMPKTGHLDDEIIPSLEITLYDDWAEFVQSLKIDFFHPDFSVQKIQKDFNFEKQIKFVQKILILVFLGALLTYLVQMFNTWYEKYVIDKISIYEPQFLWVDKTLKFQQKDEAIATNFKLNLESIEELPAEIANKAELGKEEERTTTESEVVLTSWDALPQDFDFAGQQKSEYEETKQEGYRDSLYGEKKVYRVMMKSEDPVGIKNNIARLLPKYEVSKVGKVLPGTFVPGGVYYNLFVPRKYLKEFLSQVMGIGQSVLYESRTSTGNLPGTNKVFIWIKNI